MISWNYMNTVWENYSFVQVTQLSVMQMYLNVSYYCRISSQGNAITILRISQISYEPVLLQLHISWKEFSNLAHITGEIYGQTSEIINWVHSDILGCSTKLLHTG